MASSSLSSVVSDLVRASMGSSVPTNVTDEELDRYVADLIIKEAKQKAERYLQDGVQAYLPDKDSDPNLPKANKRFLSSIIRNTDEHNRAVLRAQAEAAMEVKAEREEQERRERRARALEATEAERLRRLMGGSSRRHDNEWNSRRRDSGRRRSRDSHGGDSVDDRDDCHGRKRRRHRSRSRSPSRKGDDSRHHRQRRIRDEDEGGSSSRRHRRHSGSKPPDDERHKSSRREDSRRHKRRDEVPEVPSETKGKGKDPEEVVNIASSSHSSVRGTPRNNVSLEASDEDSNGLSKQSSHQSPTPSRKPSTSDLSAQFQARRTKLASTPPPPPSPTLSEEEDIERYRPRRKRRVSPGPSTGDAIPSNLPSKMDKYFEESYDPRLDTGPLTVPNVPSTGLVEGTEFEGWEAMLDIIRQRREDKAEKKRLERLGLLPEKKSKERDGKSPKPTEAWTMDSGTSVLDIKYAKRGSVREWDVGKTVT